MSSVCASNIDIGHTILYNAHMTTSRTTIKLNATAKNTLKRIAAQHGLIVTRGNVPGSGNLSALLQSIANGELYIITADDMRRLELARALQAAGD